LPRLKALCAGTNCPFETFVAAWLQARYGHTRGPARRKVAGDVRNAIEQMFRVALPDRAAMNHRPHAPDPLVRQSPGFWVYLRDERGLRETSIQHYRHFLRHLETYLAHRLPTTSARSRHRFSALSSLRARAPLAGRR
jgi:hypothetical protein